MYPRFQGFLLDAPLPTLDVTNPVETLQQYHIQLVTIAERIKLHLRNLMGNTKPTVSCRPAFPSSWSQVKIDETKYILAVALQTLPFST